MKTCCKNVKVGDTIYWGSNSGKKYACFVLAIHYNGNLLILAQGDSGCLPGDWNCSNCNTLCKCDSVIVSVN